ncbi:MAG: error-prone DNA polymerase [Alphaproteobacteria bacterium]|nr:error-prone DNA polymerase [Alphaproteobacteria bacterium]
MASSPDPRPAGPTGYAELQVTSNASFLRGASHPRELVDRAKTLGLAAIAITDRNSFAGIVRAHVAAAEAGLRLVPGVRLDLEDAPSLLCWPRSRAAYGRLSRLLSTGQRRAGKGGCRLTLADALDGLAGTVVALVAPDRPMPALRAVLDRLREVAGRDLHLAVHHLHRGDDAVRLEACAAIAAQARTPLLATNDVHYHEPDRRPLQDVLTCIRERCTIDTAGQRLFAHAERHLKAPGEMARLFSRHPAAVESSLAIVERCDFSLEALRYEYPDEPVPAGTTPQEHLAALAWDGARRHWPDGVPGKVRAQIDHELALIGQLGYAPYFLTVHDIVAFARSRGILCQGRGSAANSAVCYAIGITAVDPTRMDMLFERFISAARDEPPDIDVDFEHERREEVIQYIYAKYGRERAGLAATTICYRPKSAIRDVGKALGLSLDLVGNLADAVWGWGRDGFDPAHFREAGVDPDSPRVALALRLARDLVGFPRHLSQHVGGFVITKGRLDEVVPIANAAMADRTVIEWDKDDLDALGILKIDVLALGMLTCIRKALDLIAAAGGPRHTLASVPREDKAVYEMLSRADSLGVFQVESRAQMSMLPRLKPACFYDLVIEVAIVRPGPIQGDMVHPYLRRREGREAVEFPSEALRAVLGKTLGVPLFQEQAMKIAIVAAGFTPEDADRLRRAMATFRHVGTIHKFAEKFVGGMLARGYTRDFAERCFRQIEGFGTYGFPESHAASFALLVYVSAWIKRHHPAAFAAALINSQPMGFYAPAQIVRDAREHDVEIRPPDVNASDWDCTLEPTDARTGAALALRLGFRQLKGAKAEDIARIVAGRGAGYRDLAELRRRAGVGDATLALLAAADAFGSLRLGRRDALWRSLGLDAEHPELSDAPLFARLPAASPAQPDLPAASLGESVADDYATLQLSLRAHPVALVRANLPARPAILPAARLLDCADGAIVAVAGLVLVRQQPGTASGVIFMTLEDESGIANLIVWPQVFARFRAIVLGGRLVAARGRLQRQGEPPHTVIHVVVQSFTDQSDLLSALRSGASMPTLLPPLARADEVRHAPREQRPGATSLPDWVRSLPSRDFH